MGDYSHKERNHMKKKYFIALLTIVALTLSACNKPSAGDETGSEATPASPTEMQATAYAGQTQAFGIKTQTAEVAPSAIPTFTPTATFIPTLVPTDTPLPTFTPTPEVVVIPDDAFIVDGCPKKSFGNHPDTGEPLVFDMPGYPGDPDVRCHYVIWSPSRPVAVIIKTDGLTAEAGIFSFWFHGTYNLDGTLNGCPEEKVSDPKCEGTFVATGTVVVPAGVIVDVNFYNDVNKAHSRFNYVGNPNFACEYVGNDVVDENGNVIVHTEDNIVVPFFAGDNGTIYEFDRSLPSPQHCPGHENVVVPTPSTDDEGHCSAPTDNDWVWYENSFWRYEGQAISFQVPSQILRVDFKNTDSKINTAYNGDQVDSAVLANAYCK